MLEQFKLKGKTALITGGGSGIGAACAKLFAKTGAKVVIVGRNVRKLENIKKEIDRDGGICEMLSYDLSGE